ncbi:MAG TPA: hypothetical protein VHE35_19895 [Kofleriaceae bacterium]|nr:hypothetical protein [Kofleriaceae bacterium]
MKAKVEAVRKALLERGTALPAETRRAALERGALAPELAAYVDKVESNAAGLRDEDVARLKEAGLDEEQIFELTLAAALGAGLRRMEAALAALAAEKAR